VPSPSAPAVVVNPNPSAPQGPSASPAPSSGPTVLADTLIAYEGRDGGTSVVRTVLADGSGDHSLAEGGRPAWSRDGRRLLYSCTSAPGICVMNADGTGRRVVVLNGTSPAWSPDGTQIMFSRSAIDAGDTWVVEADGSNVRKVGDGAGSWSPDGTAILLVGASGAAPDARVIRPDGSGGVQLGACWGAVWSPDGRTLVCSSWDEVAGGTLYAVGASSGVKTVLLSADVSIGDQTWITPNLLALTMTRAGSSPSALPPENDLYLLDLRSGVTRRLTSGLSIVGPIDVSPDGAWLAFSLLAVWAARRHLADGNLHAGALRSLQFRAQRAVHIVPSCGLG